MISGSDQMLKILEKLGQSNECDLSFVKSDYLLKYMKELKTTSSENAGSNVFYKTFPTANIELVNLLT